MLYFLYTYLTLYFFLNIWIFLFVYFISFIFLLSFSMQLSRCLKLLRQKKEHKQNISDSDIHYAQRYFRRILGLQVFRLPLKQAHPLDFLAAIKTIAYL